MIPKPRGLFMFNWLLITGIFVGSLLISIPISYCAKRDIAQRYARFTRDSLFYKAQYEAGKLSAWEYDSLVKGSKELNNIR